MCVNDQKPNPDKHDQINIINSIIEQNLLHARHAETQRLMFNSLYMVIISAGLAFIFEKNSNECMSMVLIVFLMGLGTVTGLLTTRWNNVFDCHYEEAKKGYVNLQKKYFNNLNCYVEYPFKVPSIFSAKQLFFIYRILIQFVLLICLVNFACKGKCPF